MTSPPNLIVLDTGRTIAAEKAEELLKALADDIADWQDMLVIGYDAEGHVKQRSTRMTKAQALMLMEQWKKRLLEE